MAKSIYEYSGFYTQAKVVSDSQDVPTYSNREMLQKLYNADSVFWSKAERGSGNSTQIAAFEIVIDKKTVDSTEYNLYLSRFKNLPNITFARWKTYQDNSIGLANSKNAQKSVFDKVDAEWVSSRFMTGNKYLGGIDRTNRFFTTTGWKFESTKWGQNMAINPRPQFTRTCDIRGNNRATSVSKNSIAQKDGNSNDYTIGILSQPESDSKVDFGLGMGRYYSEAIDDNATQIYLQFGVPKFNSLISFFINAVSYEDSYIANYGRIPLAYKTASIISGFVVWCAFPLITSTIFLLKKIIEFALGHPFNYYYMEPSMHTYWTSVNLIINQIAAELGIMAPMLKDDEDATGNTKKVKMGVPVRVSSSDIRELSKYMPRLFNPNTGYIDIYHLATRVQVIANYLNKIEYEIYNKRDKDGNAVNQEVNGWLGNGNNFFKKTQGGFERIANWFDRKAYLSDWLRLLLRPDTAKEGDKKEFKDMHANSSLVVETENIDMNKGKYSFRDDPEKSEDTINDQITRLEEKLKPTGYDSATNAIELAYRSEKNIYENTNVDTSSEEYLNFKLSYLKNENAKIDKAAYDINEGGIKDNKPTYDVLTGLYTTIPDGLDWIKDKLEGLTDKAISWALSGSDTFDAVVREGGGYAIFNVDYTGSVSESWSNSSSEIDSAGLTKTVSKGARDLRFNLTGGLLETAVGQVVEGLKNVAMATVESFSFGLSNVVASLLGGGYADMPKKWDDSDFSFPSVSYTMQLVAPYGNPISQMQNIYIPLAMIMAGSLPLQAGKSSYTSPFLCSIYNKGVQDVRLGMITEVSVTRGITNMPFSRHKRMLSCEVSFKVTDFSTRLVAPINSSPFKTLFSMNWDDDTPTGIYLATLASRDLYTNKYIIPKTKLKLARMAMAFSQMTSEHNWAMRVGEFFKPPFALFTPDRRFPENQRNYL